MRLAGLAAPTAALLLTSTALLAQQGATAGGSVFLDVGDRPVLVPIALAAEACDLDVEDVEQASRSRVDQSEFDDAALQQIFAATGSTGVGDTDVAANGTIDGTIGADETAGLSGEVAGVGTTGTAGTSPGTLDAGAGATSIAEAANTPAPGGEPVDPEALGGSMSLATADGVASDLNGVLDSAETTAADAGTTSSLGLDGSSVTSDQILTLAVCQVDVTRAAEFGIGEAGTVGTDASGG